MMLHKVLSIAILLETNTDSSL